MHFWDFYELSTVHSGFWSRAEGLKLQAQQALPEEEQIPASLPQARLTNMGDVFGLHAQTTLYQESNRRHSPGSSQQQITTM
jgi:hypothetical protein